MWIGITRPYSCRARSGWPTMPGSSTKLKIATYRMRGPASGVTRCSERLHAQCLLHERAERRPLVDRTEDAVLAEVVGRHERIRPVVEASTWVCLRQVAAVGGEVGIRTVEVAVSELGGAIALRHDGGKLLVAHEPLQYRAPDRFDRVTRRSSDSCSLRSGVINRTTVEIDEVPRVQQHGRTLSLNSDVGKEWRNRQLVQNRTCHTPTEL